MAHCQRPAGAMIKRAWIAISIRRGTSLTSLGNSCTLARTWSSSTIKPSAAARIWALPKNVSSFHWRSQVAQLSCWSVFGGLLAVYLLTWWTCRILTWDLTKTPFYPLKKSKPVFLKCLNRRFWQSSRHSYQQKNYFTDRSPRHGLLSVWFSLGAALTPRPCRDPLAAQMKVGRLFGCWSLFLVWKKLCRFHTVIRPRNRMWQDL